MCWLCNRAISLNATRQGRRVSLEHLTPRCRGGGDELENLVHCHHACNLHLRNHPAEKKLKMREKWHRETARMLGRSPRSKAKRLQRISA
jgi:hypothetical protein